MIATRDLEMVCISCGKEEPKYRCPRCSKRYCSVACCKLHKASSCIQAGQGGDKGLGEGDEGKGAREKAESETTLTGIDVLNPSQMKILVSDPHIRKMLGSKRLQSHIRTVDEAEDRPEALKKLRKNNEAFHEFVGKMLDTVQEGSDEVEKNKHTKKI